MLTAILLGWIACGVFAYGRLLAGAQREFPTIARECAKSDCRMAAGVALFGPFAAIVAAIACRHGFLWRPLTEDEAADLRLAERRRNDVRRQREREADRRAEERAAKRGVA